MNLNQLSDLELINYLDLHSDDPLTRRLVDMLSATRGGIVSDLVEAGMDPNTWTFEDDYQNYHPGDYITHLKKELDYANDDKWVAEQERNDMREERDRLKIRSVIDVLAEAQTAILTANSLTREAVRTADKASEENKLLREQLGMWTIMKTE